VLERCGNKLPSEPRYAANTAGLGTGRGSISHDDKPSAGCCCIFVKRRKPSGEVVFAFLAVVYFAGLRSEEVTSLYVRGLTLPDTEKADSSDDGWGEIVVSKPLPEVGKRWTDSGTHHNHRRQPKGRDQGEVRSVPCCPELVAIVRTFITARRLEPGDRLCTSVREGNLLSEGDLLSMVVVRRALDAARLEVLGPGLAETELAATIYSFRHVRLTDQLNSGVPSAQVALWAGNSVKVLLENYINCVTGQDADYKRKISQSMRLEAGCR
jgi:hypothetical protein